MNDTPLYQQIADSIRREILEGRLHPGDRLPPVRRMTSSWDCTPGTVQRAYQELARQGLVTSHAGQGTRVAGDLSNQSTASDTPLRHAALVHRAEAFLLEALAAGHAPAEIEDAVRAALDRWLAVEQTPAPATSENILRFSGSHDLALSWIAAHFDEIAPGSRLSLSFTGSLGGLMALAEGRADVAGCHLWDQETSDYNLPFIKRLLPGQPVALVTLAHRRLGLMLAPGNPLGLYSLTDLRGKDIRFAQRQPGSGTRVWLDANLARLGIDPSTLNISGESLRTHSEVAQAVAEGRAYAGLGLEAAARAFGLEFIPLTRERYDLVVPVHRMQNPAIQKLVDWLTLGSSKPNLIGLIGYDWSSAGEIQYSQ
jgi:putative molybdopterin biosynthesis protein